jgi:hypothetical protein
MVVDLRSKTSQGVPCEHQRGYLLLPHLAPKGSVIQRNIFYSREAGQKVLFEGKHHAQPALLRDCRADYNLYFCDVDDEWGKRHLAEQRPFGIEQHSIVADPLFVDVERGDLRLKDDSPALKLGFEPIDLSDVGPRE